jgi:hypothetical protein
MTGKIPIEIRNLRFATDKAPEPVPRYWHGGRRSVTTFFDNLSTLFPVGERFFVRSVRVHESLIKDPALLGEMRAFYGQEGMHGREHVRYNAMLRAHGMPIDPIEDRVKALLGLVTRVLTRRQRLAVTAALEHFTALLGHMVLEDDRLLTGAHPEMAALWRWHSVEENEHKGVAFDVYEAVGGTYLERCWIMLAATVVFWAKVLEQQARLMHHDGTLWSAKEWATLARFLFVEAGWLTRLWGPYLDWFRPDFHPWDLDSQGLIDRWKSLYEVPAASV